jgi:hypothetical protein
VRDAAAAIEGNKRSRSDGQAEEPIVTDGNPDLVFDVESNTMVPRASIPEERPISKKSVMGLLAAFKKELSESFETANAAAIKASHDSLKVQVFEHVEQLLSAYDEQSQKRFTELESSQGEQGEQLAKHESDLDTLRKDIARLQEQVGVAANAKPSKNQLAAVGWDEPADGTILELNTENSTPITKDAAKEGITKWLSDSGIAEEGWSLEGEELDRRFKIRFKGEVGYATLRARKAYGTIRCGDGTYRQLTACTPTDSSSVKLYIKPSQNAKERKLERDAKRLFKALQPRLQGKKVSWVKREGTISVDWRLVARVQVYAGDEPSTLQFNMAAMRDLGLEKNVFAEAFSNIGSNNKVAWSL